MGLVRWVHVANALFWSVSAAVGWWWAREARVHRSRRRIYAVVALAGVLGAESLLQALAAHHPSSSAHVVAEIMLALTGIVACFVVAAYGHEIVTDERVLYALSHRRLGSTEIQRAATPVPLTQRETEVIRCLCDGLGTDEIAARLSISPHTTTTHVRNILRKLHVGSRADAIVWAVEHGVLAGKR